MLSLLSWIASGAAQDPCGTIQAVSPDLISEMYASLPERTPIKTGLAANIDKNIQILPEYVGGSITVTFLAEGAGYKNQFGWMVFDPLLADVVASPGDAILDSGVFWANASAYDSGGSGVCLTQGHTLKLTIRPEWVGYSFGYWLKPNGYNTPSATNWYSVEAFNNDTPDEHAIVFASQYSQDDLILGFEDLQRKSAGCDHDFNDLIVGVSSDPPEIIEDVIVRNGLGGGTGDADHDGVPDAFDDFPTDPARAIRNVFPPDGNYAHVAFEDLYPEVGDGDYNDLVVASRFEEILNADNRILEFHGQHIVIARGAGYDHAFRLRIPGSGAGSWTVTRRDAAGNALATTSGRATGAADLLLLPSTRQALPVWNTVPGDPVQPGGSVEWTFIPDVPKGVDDGVAAPPYDPYLVVAQTGYDIHLPGRLPIAGSADPDRDFLDANGYPFAILIPLDWQPPVERAFIENEDVYPAFKTWREAGGLEAPDWYRTPAARTFAVPAERYIPFGGAR